MSVNLIVRLIDQAYDHKAWHGPTLRGSPRGVRAETAAWKRDLRLLEETHQELRSAVLTVSDDRLEQIPAGSKTVLADLLLGIASHDLYHAGQIQLIKRLQRATE